MNFRHIYYEHQHQVRAQLQAARGRVRLASGDVDSARMTERRIADVAMRDAEVVVNMAINLHNEQVARRG